MNTKEKITTVCYGETTIWNNRRAAMNHFFEGILATEGSEQARYTRIYCALKDGLNYCTDEE